MTREQIEKAAMLFAGAGEWGECPYNSDAKNGFTAGAEWRINAVWHSTDELPERSGYLAVLMDNGLMETMYYSVGIGFLEMQLKGYTLWAYISELRPERKEEAK